MSDRFAVVQIGSIYLTDSGEADGRPCRVNVPDEEVFASSFVSSPNFSADGLPYFQLANIGVVGKEFSIRLEFCPETLIESLVEEIEEGLETGEGVRVIVESLNDFDVQCLPIIQNGKLYSFESRSGGIAKAVTFRFLSTGAGS